MALSPNAQDRPEILVQKSGSGKPTTTLLAVEVKARKNFGMRDMKGALFFLQEWNPEAIVGANYFNIESEHRFSVVARDHAAFVAADECAPRSETATETLAVAGRFLEAKAWDIRLRFFD